MAESMSGQILAIARTMTKADENEQETLAMLCAAQEEALEKRLRDGVSKEMCESADKPDLVIAIGPPIMMKFCVETVRPYGVPVVVSLNTIMVDGTGMCGGCRVNVGGQTRFVCVDGPEFDGLQVDFDGMMKRLGCFKPQERRMMDHACHLLNEAEQRELAKK